MVPYAEHSQRETGGGGDERCQCDGGLGAKGHDHRGRSCDGGACTIEGKDKDAGAIEDEKERFVSRFIGGF